ncbi:MAG: hypothetical protein A2X86_16230 [Bdellovibrionales bacterium GWA2_49_15]|nr:MAG: hypothetical protein A2X86_16230 [Bdellovibrionales bacterium GWA2_49_15]HAZ13654.1 hypothetical protein [Bdellovibrionales bacterium]
MLIFLFALPALAVDFSKIPSSRTVEQSQALFKERSEQVFADWLKGHVPAFAQEDGLGFGLKSSARLVKGVDLPQIEASILDPKALPWAKYGTDIVILGGLCKRVGDYDFTLQGLIRMLYVSELLAPIPLSKAAFDKTLFTLITPKGNQPYTHFSLGLCGVHRDTENHILMTETTRLLANQLMHRHPEVKDKELYNNQKNGISEWMLNFLQYFFETYFEEYNSRPYQGYTVMALNNLHSFSLDEKVKIKAHMVLDILSGVFAVQSNGGRRSVPFRRQPEYDGDSDILRGDGEIGRFNLLAGQYDYLAKLSRPHVPPYGNHYMMAAAVSEYRPGPEILDLILKESGQEFFQTIHHEGVELYSQAPLYTISAGGMYVNKFDMATKEQDGWARPTTIIPTRDSSSEYIHWPRFEGHKHRLRRQNTCVYGNFACGLNLVLPATLPATCLEKKGEWSFYHLDQHCALNWGLYLAVWSRPCTNMLCKLKTKNFGVMEVEASEHTSFENFQANILERNKVEKYKFHGTNTYVTSRGLGIEFNFSSSLGEWEIERVGGQKMQTKIKDWPLFRGDILNTPSQGVVTIRNPLKKRELVLDAHDVLNPKRFWRELP